MVDFQERADLAISLKKLKLLESHKEPPRRLALYRHPVVGRVLVIDDEVQHVESWQALYHEPLVHVPSSFIETVRSALILGGGSLFAAREVLRYETVRSCILVDHDPRVVEMMARHYPHARMVIKDPRFRLVSADAAAYIRSCDQHFDLIVNDWINLTDDADEQRPNLMASMTSLLTKTGVCADVMYRHMFETGHVRRTRAALVPFGPAAYSLVVVPEYPGALHILSMWGNRHVRQGATTPRNRTQAAWKRRARPIGMQFYDPRFLAFYLFLPPYIRAQLEL